MQKLPERQVKRKETVRISKMSLSKEERHCGRIPRGPSGISQAVDRGCARQEH